MQKRISGLPAVDFIRGLDNYKLSCVPGGIRYATQRGELHQFWFSHFIQFTVMSVFLMFANGWGCDQFGGAGLGIYPTLRSSLRADPTP